MIRDQLYEDALARLHELRRMRVIYVSDGSPGGDKVAHLLAFAQAVIPDLIKALELWFDDMGDDDLESIRFELAMNILKTPVDQGVAHLMESFRRAAGDD
jgi:hypothetical protein